jgi:hypothetical protein
MICCGYILSIVLGVEGADPIIATYDASGKSPQCSEGARSYMENCVFPSDFYFYIVADKPSFGKPGVSCTDMGWNESEHIFHGGHDPIFHGFDGYWHGGDKVFGVYDAALHASHDSLGDIGEFLAASREYNPACNLPQQPMAHPHFSSSSLPLPAGNDTAVLFDEKGEFGQCLEAPYMYLRDCVVPSDLFTFLLARKPTLEGFNRTCEELGYTAADTSSVFEVRSYWKGGPTAAEVFLSKYRDGHSNISAFLSRTRDGNPACKL